MLAARANRVCTATPRYSTHSPQACAVMANYMQLRAVDDQHARSRGSGGPQRHVPADDRSCARLQSQRFGSGSMSIRGYALTAARVWRDHDRMPPVAARIFLVATAIGALCTATVACSAAKE